MKNKLFGIVILSTTLFANGFAQENDSLKTKGYVFSMQKDLTCSPVNNQQRAGTCWSYSSIGMIESEMIRNGKAAIDLSEMFVVHKSYEEKAWNYIRMHGAYNFGGGGAINDAFNVLKNYGAIPQELYEGLNYGTKVHTHGELDEVLKSYLDGVLKNKNKNKKLSTAWFEGYKGILDAYLGKIPETFEWEGKKYTPRTFADELVEINPDNYYFFTSFNHHDFYTQFVLEVPDNWTWSLYWNVPIDDLMQIFDNSINNGHTCVWANDVSEKGFSSTDGIAVIPEEDLEEMDGEERLKWEAMTEEDRKWELYNFEQPVPEKKITQELRQQAFDNRETTDDHGMVIAGIAKDQNGTKYYYIKNSWGSEYNNYGGYFYASETFVKYKTLSAGVHKDAIPKEIKKKLGIK